MKLAVEPASQRVIFPSTEVTAALTEWWDDETASRINNPLEGLPNTLFAAIPHMDSLRLVNALLSLDSILGFEIPLCVIRKGGYTSKGDMFQHLIPRLEQEFIERHNRKTH